MGNNHQTNLRIRSILLVGGLMAIAGCNKEKLTPLNSSLVGVMDYGTVDARFCTQDPSPAKQKLKYLFILDHSASNKPGFPFTAGDISNTDALGSRRYGPMVNFIQNLVPDPNNITYFGLIDFNTDAYLLPGGTAFDPDSANFLTNVTKDWVGGGTNAAPSPFDKSFTNYQSALNLAYQFIRSDVQAESLNPIRPIITSVYQIIFVTDGIPVVAAAAGSLNPTYTQVFATDLKPVIDNIMDLKNDAIVGPFISNVVLNTAYYFNDVSIPEAGTLLQQMANEGNGNFIQFGSGKNILYQQFAPPSRNIRNHLVDVFVENQNGIWWDDGRFMLDSDGDGLPDAIEKQFGSDPHLADSDGNGVNDLVEYRTKGRPCKDLACARAARDLYAICDGFSPVVDSNGSVTFSASTNDGLNDCEKFILGASRSTFNTNGNIIPDFFAMKNALPIIPGSGSSSFADPFGNGLTNYSKLKIGLPTQVSSQALVNFEQRITSLSLESSPTPMVDCYHLNVQNVALSNFNNSIKVMVVQNGAAIDDKPFLQAATRSFDGTSTLLSFSKGDFK